jgi:hypothetical protein
MNRIKFQIILLLGFMIYGCATSDIKTTWKALHNSPGKYNKILVVGIIKDEDTTLRSRVEKHLTDDLKESGYKAVSALEEYGPGGLANLGQQETYIKLRKNGIDAIITIALIDKSKEKSQKSSKAVVNASIYYYNRIWNYPAIQAELVNGKYPPANDFFWESILYDLNTLEPQITVQTNSFKSGTPENIAHEYGKQIIGLMIKEKILQKQMNEPKSNEVKSF